MHAGIKYTGRLANKFWPTASLGSNSIFGMNANAGNILVLQWYMAIFIDTMLTTIGFSCAYLSR